MAGADIILDAFFEFGIAGLEIAAAPGRPKLAC
jgi:hypothetical protein